VVFIPADENSSSVIDMLAQREKIIKELLDNRMPAMVSLCTLVASFQNLEKICTELLPCQYFQLINDLWQEASPVFEKYYGTYGRHAGNEMLYFFIKEHDDKYLTNSINCATELRKVVSNFIDRYARQKGLSHKLYLNIGVVHEGREFFGTIRSGGHVEFAALGTSVKVARQLSEFATKGEIWATKDLICKMPTEDREGLTFGVYRNHAKGKILQLDSFTLPGDLVAADNASSMALEPIGNLAITEITQRTSK
jgi:class 3 adenylate cyclase